MKIETKNFYAIRCPDGQWMTNQGSYTSDVRFAILCYTEHLAKEWMTAGDEIVCVSITFPSNTKHIRASINTNDKE